MKNKTKTGECCFNIFNLVLLPSQIYYFKKGLVKNAYKVLIKNEKFLDTRIESTTYGQTFQLEITIINKISF